MRRRRWMPVVFIAAALVLLAGATVWATTGAQEPEPAAPLAALTTGFTYQGKLEEDGVPKDSTCDMGFRLYDAAVLGRQIGSTILKRGVPVKEGLFTVGLDFGESAFRGSRRWLDVQVQCLGDREFTDLGRQELTAVPYALYAMDAPWGGLPYAGVVVVAKSGGDFGSVQAAIDSITGADETNPYLVWVAPGVYEERMTMKPYVHLQGAGQEATIIRSDERTTLHLAGHTSLRDLTVLNISAGSESYAIEALSTHAVTGTLLAGVTARAQGTGDLVKGILLSGSDTSVRLVDVIAHAEGGSDFNFGLGIQSSATAILQGGSFTASGGDEAYAIDSGVSGNTLEATGVFALAENATMITCGLSNFGTATLHGGSFAAHGGDCAYGIYNGGTDASLEAESVTAEGLDGITDSYGLRNYYGSSAVLNGGSFTARGSESVYGIANVGSSTTLEAESVTAEGLDGGASSCGLCLDSGASAVLHGGSFTAHAEGGTSYNRGLEILGGATAMLQGGSYTASGGVIACGISSVGNGSILEATGVFALAENGTEGRGLYNTSTAILHGGTFAARGGEYVYGIINDGGGAILEAQSVTAEGLETNAQNYGLSNKGGASATLHGGSFTAHEGSEFARGILNIGSGTTLQANGISALAADATSANWGLDSNYEGTSAHVTLSILEGSALSVVGIAGTEITHSRLVGGQVGNSVTCVAVSYLTGWYQDTCP